MESDEGLRIVLLRVALDLLERDGDVKLACRALAQGLAVIEASGR